MARNELTIGESRELFEHYAPIFQKYDSPISVATRLAQCYVESKMFNSELAELSNNGFGIKASAPWTGDKVKYTSKSDNDPAEYRKYKTEEDSIADHAAFFTSTSHREHRVYKAAIGATTYIGEASSLTGTYAGDPQYGVKLINTIEKFNLTQYNKEDGAMGKKIGIDIGHGSDTWSSGGGKGVVVNGKVYQEHDFNSIVAKKLKLMLERLGYKVYFGVQQPNSPDTSLTSRSTKFNSLGVDILISIHANWTNSPSVNGIAGFYDGYISGSSRLNNSKKLSQNIMGKFKTQGQKIYTGGMGDNAGSIPSYSGSWTDFHMNRQTNMPSVLMELGFMSGNSDFNHIFGTQQSAYTDQMAAGIASGIDAYFGITRPIEVDANPQKLSTVPMKEYVEPSQPFTALPVGSEVTLAVNFQWADLNKQELMRSNKYDEFVGTTDTIKAVKEIKDLPKRNHSNRAYLLEKYNSWILEEYLVESKKDWKDGVVAVPEEDLDDAVEDKTYDVYEVLGGYIKVKKTKEVNGDAEKEG